MIHAELMASIEREFATVASAALCRDAVLVSLRNEVAVELRFADAHEYSIGWRWGDAEQRIDTAPLHREVATFPNHWHDADGRVQADPLTRPGHEPWANARAVISALLDDPLLAWTR